MANSAADVAATVGRKMVALERSVTGKGPMISTVRKSKRTLEAKSRPDMGGDLALSNWRRSRPVRVRIRDSIGRDSTAKITPLPIGPMKVITVGRKAGVSRGRRYSSSRGKGTWFRARDAASSDASKVFRREQIKDIAKAFKG